MRVYTAPEKYQHKSDDICIFLAGGICKCQDWQSMVIKELENVFNLNDNVVIFNPRRETFDMSDPDAGEKQIKWEFDKLQKMDIFTMFFAPGESNQPICMYELGRNLARFYYQERIDNVVVSVCSGYKRADDVVIQSNLAGYYGTTVYTDYDYAVKMHAQRIIDKILEKI